MNSLVNLSGLSQPVTKLVEVVAAGIGTLYAPFGTVRQARADARAKLIHAQADAAVATLEVRAETRCKYIEAVRQENIEQVVTLAASELPDEVASDPVDQDWILKFFDHAQDVCDDDMRRIWARILAGETAQPGSFSKRTLDFLKNLEKTEAEMFTKFASLIVLDQTGWGYVFLEDQFYQHHRDLFDKTSVETHFVSIGLLGPNTIEVVPSNFTDKKFSYFGSTYTAQGPAKKDGGLFELPVSVRGLTSIGQQLLGIAGGTPRDGYIQSLFDDIESKYGVSFHLQEIAE